MFESRRRRTPPPAAFCSRRRRRPQLVGAPPPPTKITRRAAADKMPLAQGSRREYHLLSIFCVLNFIAICEPTGLK